MIPNVHATYSHLAGQTSAADHARDARSTRGAERSTDFEQFLAEVLSKTQADLGSADAGRVSPEAGRPKPGAAEASAGKPEAVRPDADSPKLEQRGR